MTYQASARQSLSLPSGALAKVVGAPVATVAVFVGGSTAPDWAPLPDWQLPGLVIGLAVGAGLLVLVGLEVRGLVVASVVGLLVGFLSVNTGPLQPQVFRTYGQLVQATTGHPLCAEGAVLNRAETGCIRDPGTKPAPKKAPARKAAKHG